MAVVEVPERLRKRLLQIDILVDSIIIIYIIRTIISKNFQLSVIVQFGW